MNKERVSQPEYARLAIIGIIAIVMGLLYQCSGVNDLDVSRPIGPIATPTPFLLNK